MATIDFTEIPHSDNGYEFEHFVQDLLNSLGWNIITKVGVGPDGGRDIIASFEELTATGITIPRKYLIQCKHNAHSNSSVSSKDIDNFLVLPGQHGTQGWLLVTSTRLTEDCVQKIKGANIALSGVIFNFWTQFELQEKLFTDKCRQILKKYLPNNYRKINDIIIPTISEINDIFQEWFVSYKDYSNLFYFNIDKQPEILSFISTNEITISKLREILFDNSILTEFVNIWKTKLSRGNIKGNIILLLKGISRLLELKNKKLPSKTIENILIGELTITAYHRKLKREYWKNFIVYTGISYEWTSFHITPKNSYIPPDFFKPPFVCFKLLIFCNDKNDAASGLIRIPSTSEEIPFCTSMQLETSVSISYKIIDNPFPSLNIKLDTGSNNITISCIGHGIIKGFNLENNKPIVSWNILT